MKEYTDHIRQSDVTTWGVVALVCGALAVLSANLGAMLPTHVMTGLHATKSEGGSLNQLRSQVADLQEDTARLRAENTRIASLVRLTEQGSGDLMRRVGSIEASLPALFDAGPRGADVDASLTTAGIGEGITETIETENGRVVVSRRPLARANQTAITIQERPESLDATDNKSEDVPMQGKTGPASAFGLALGEKVSLRDSVVGWNDISRKAGPLLLGLDPVLSGVAGAEQMQLVAGPIASYTEAEQICSRLLRIGVSCLPVPYMGNALPE